MDAISEAIARAKAVAARLSAEAKANGSRDTAETVQLPVATKRLREDEDDPPTSGYSSYKRRYDDSDNSGRNRQGLGSSERAAGDSRYDSSGRSGKISSEMSIPSNMVGLVIGKGGDNMKRIEKESGAKIQFSQDQSQSDPERRTTITGNENEVRAAKKMIQEIVDGNARRSEPSDSAPSGHYGPSKTTGSSYAKSHAMEVPSSKVGLVIGKGGETIKSLQERSGARITVVPDSATDPKSNTRTVNISGTDDAVEQAKGLISDIVFGGVGGGSGGGKFGSSGAGSGERFLGPDCEELKVPNDRVGLVIGKGGEAIKSIQSMFNVRVVIEQIANHQDERSIKIYGTKDDIFRAVEAILEKTMRNKGASSQSSYGNGFGGYGTASSYSNYQYDQSAAYANYGYDSSYYQGSQAADSSGYFQASQQAPPGAEGQSADAAAHAEAWNAYYAAYYQQYGAQAPQPHSEATEK